MNTATQTYRQTSTTFPNLRGIAASLLATSASPVSTLARLALGLVMFPHGAQKMLGWFGGYGFQGTLHAFTEGMGIPSPLAFLAIAAEFFGSIALLLGVFTRPAAAAIAVNMVVAAVLVHLPNGFFMNWTGKGSGEGFEYHILALALALVIVILGGGRFSLDRGLRRWLEPAPGARS